MAVETAADRLTFLNADEFGIEAAYAPVGGGPGSTVKGIFDNDYLQVDGEQGATATRAPRFVCREADLSLNGREGDMLVISGVSYRVVTPHSDGTGMTTLWLEKQ